jgi:hypothetical protein
LGVTDDDRQGSSRASGLCTCIAGVQWEHVAWASELAGVNESLTRNFSTCVTDAGFCVSTSQVCKGHLGTQKPGNMFNSSRSKNN